MKIYIPTSNNSIYLVEALLFSLKKYWPNYSNYKIIILGYNKPEYSIDDNVSFFKLNNHDPIENWAIDLKNYFSTVTDDNFIYMNDDCPLSRIVDSELLNFLKELIFKNKNNKIGRICLTKDISKNQSHFLLEDLKEFQIIESYQNAKYRTSTQFSIWNREYFLKYLKPNLTPWEYEGLTDPLNDGWRILGTRSRYCLDFYHLKRKGDQIPTDWNISCYERKNMQDSAEDFNFIKQIMNI